MAHVNGLSLNHSSMPSPPDAAINNLTSRLTALTSHLENILSLSESLQAQHTAAQSTISFLETKVEKLEGLVKAASQPPPPPPVVPVVEVTKASESREDVSQLTSILKDWRKIFEGQWAIMQDVWQDERDRLSKAREEFEAKSCEYELRSSTASWVQSNVSPNHQSRMGLLTPPSPRSLNTDSSREWIQDASYLGLHIYDS
jgi:hypothetical protein